MPVTPPGIIGAIVPNLVSVAFTGTDVPKYANAVAQGLVRWIPLVKVSTVDVGTAGVGVNVPLPLPVPTPVIYANLLIGMAAQGFNGPFLPVFCQGLSNGLALAFLQMLIRTNHPSVGAGAGQARFNAPPAASSMLAGFASAGMNGPSTAQAARSVAICLDRTFASLVIPVAIVGPSSPSASSGSGFGGIL
jgi:hypothetical protein